MYWAFHGTRLTRSETVQLIDDHDNGFLNLKKVPVVHTSPSTTQTYNHVSSTTKLFKYLDGHTWLLQEGLYTNSIRRETREALNTSPNSKGYHRSLPVTVSISEVKPFVHSWIALAFWTLSRRKISGSHQPVKTDNRAINLRYATLLEQTANRTLNFKVIPRNVSKNASLSTLSRRMERRKLTPICSRL
jgi:hypothetical protein